MRSRAPQRSEEQSVNRMAGNPTMRSRAPQGSEEQSVNRTVKG
jgi:hypothetical protein